MEEHFGNTAGATIVTVNLEGRVSIEEVVVATTIVAHLNHVRTRVTQGKCEVAASVFAVQTAGISVCLPTHRPTCDVAITCNLAIVGSLEQFLTLGSLVESANLAEWIQTHQVRKVAVTLI